MHYGTKLTIYLSNRVLVNLLLHVVLADELIIFQQATREVIDKEAPGLVHAMTAGSLNVTKLAMLSRYFTNSWKYFLSFVIKFVFQQCQ